ncbi:MAG: DNA translocase FtsK 4TM domain-containing protein, partial [Chloroflexota bacterium]|nr:DNA translocase FtsK 4TM domain-containing protein [Chloroflexota bacterium]
PVPRSPAPRGGVGLLGSLFGTGGRGGWNVTLPVIPPDTLFAVFNVRFLGLLCVLAGGFTLVALLSPTGTVTGAWAERTRIAMGWAAAPWCAVLIAGGIALFYGRRSLRRTVAGRLIGAAFLLLACTGLHQLVTAPPLPGVSPADVVQSGRLGSQPGSGGYVGLVFGAALAAWFGVLGAALLLLLVAVFGLGLLCGLSLTSWQRLAVAAASALATRAHHGWGLITAVGRTMGRVTAWSAVRLRHAATATGRATARQATRGARGLARVVQSGVQAGIRLTFQAGRDARRAGATLPDNSLARAAAEADASTGTRSSDARPPVAVDASSAARSTGERGGTPAAATALLETGITLDLADPPAPERVVPRPPAGAVVQWQLPSTAILTSTTAEQISEAEISEKARLIERTLGAFNVPVAVMDARIGPRVTQFLLKPAEGISVKKIKSFEADLQLVLAAQTLRIELPVPGRPVVGIEIPNSGIANVGLREMLETSHFRDTKGPLRVALGRDVDGNPRVGDLTRMPHLLIAGQTGSGKSFCVNSIIASLLFQATPDELNLLMIDPKMVEMAQYEDIPHLRYPVVVDLAEAGKVLLWAVEEMERRYKLMAEAGFRHIDSYNKSLVLGAPRPDWLAAGAPLPKPFPYMVIVIDELADLMMFAPDDVEPAICRLTAKARAVGIHLVVATQRPSVNVV